VACTRGLSYEASRCCRPHRTTGALFCTVAVDVRVFFRVISCVECGAVSPLLFPLSTLAPPSFLSSVCSAQSFVLVPLLRPVVPSQFAGSSRRPPDPRAGRVCARCPSLINLSVRASSHTRFTRGNIRGPFFPIAVSLPRVSVCRVVRVSCARKRCRFRFFVSSLLLLPRQPKPPRAPPPRVLDVSPPFVAVTVICSRIRLCPSPISVCVTCLLRVSHVACVVYLRTVSIPSPSLLWNTPMLLVGWLACLFVCLFCPLGAPRWWRCPVWSVSVSCLCRALWCGCFVYPISPPSRCVVWCVLCASWCLFLSPRRCGACCVVRPRRTCTPTTSATTAGGSASFFIAESFLVSRVAVGGCCCCVRRCWEVFVSFGCFPLRRETVEMETGTGWGDARHRLSICGYGARCFPHLSPSLLPLSLPMPPLAPFPHPTPSWPAVSLYLCH
jgi:hypothetical protein